MDGHLTTIGTLLAQARDLGSSVEQLIQPLLHRALQSADCQPEAEAAGGDLVHGRVAQADEAMPQASDVKGEVPDCEAASDVLPAAADEAEGDGKALGSSSAAASDRASESISWISDLLFEHKGPSSSRTLQPGPQPSQTVAAAETDTEPVLQEDPLVQQAEADAAASQAVSSGTASSAGPEEPAEPVQPDAPLAASAGSRSAPAVEAVEQQGHVAKPCTEDESSAAVLPAGARLE